MPRSPTARSSSARPSSPRRRAPARVAARSTSSASSVRAASTPTTAISSRSPSSPVASASRASASTRCSTAATRRRHRPSASSAILEERLAAAHPDAAIASVGGRYFAMDRDHRWDRVERGYDAIVHGEATEHAASATAAIEAAYARGETDEFVAPTVIDGRADPIEPGDPIIHANFRADRARQLTHALADGPAFDGFDRRSPAGRAAPDRPARRDDDRVRGAICRSRSPSRPRRPARSPRPSRRPAGASSTSPRPRSTPTSRTSSTAASRRRTRARSGCSSRARRSRPTTSSRR